MVRSYQNLTVCRLLTTLIIITVGGVGELQRNQKEPAVLSDDQLGSVFNGGGYLKLKFTIDIGLSGGYGCAATEQPYRHVFDGFFGAFSVQHLSGHQGRTDLRPAPLGHRSRSRRTGRRSGGARGQRTELRPSGAGGRNQTPAVQAGEPAQACPPSGEWRSGCSRYGRRLPRAGSQVLCQPSPRLAPTWRRPAHTSCTRQRDAASCPARILPRPFRVRSPPIVQKSNA